MAAESEIGALIELAKTSPIAFIVVAPMVFSIWLILKTTKGRGEAAPKEPEDHAGDLLREVQALHATVKASAAKVEAGQANLLLEIVRQGAKE